MAKKVAVIMGSDSDLPVMESCIEVLKEFGVSHATRILSAHRTPDRTASFAANAEKQNYGVIIAAAGGAAHLAGAVAAQTTLPVIGVPLSATPLSGFDALLATVQMPGGIPVATFAIGKAGAKNAGLFAAAILARSDAAVRERLAKFREAQAAAVPERPY